jgi:DNA-binding transcriptional regulator GbsR (MarR family)
VTTPVSDARSNANDQLAHAAKSLGRSEHRRQVFRAIYAGKRQAKTVDEIAATTGITRKQVLTEGKVLANNHIVHQVVARGQTAYEKDPFFAQHRDRILRLANDPNKLRELPTKTNPRGVTGTTRIMVPRSLIRI